MKLIKCYIENFGKLHNYSYNFEDGLNIIKEENGFGKTTFATFIKSMFYGLDNAVNVKTEKSDRKKYYPWQGGNYGGNIEFEINNKQYKIERFFGKKASEDTFKLYNLSTNLESNDYTENIGEEIFKINKSAYERSTYIPQGQIQIEMEDSLSAKLGNVLESDNDINTSEDAIKKLNESKKVFKKDKGKGGLIDESKDKLFELQRKLENSKTDLETLDARKEQLNIKIEEIKQLDEKRENAQKILANKIEQDRQMAKKQTYNTYLENYNSAEEKYLKLKEFFSNGVPEDIELEILAKKNQELEKTKIETNNYNFSEEEKNTLLELKNIFDGKNITLDDIDKSIVYCSKVQEIENNINKLKLEEENAKKTLDKINAEKKKNKISVIFTILGIVCFIIGILFVVLNLQRVAGIILIAIGMVVSISSFVNKSKNIKEEHSQYKDTIKNIGEKINQAKIENEEMNLEINRVLGSFYPKSKENSARILNLTNLKEKLSLYKKLQIEKSQKESLLQNAIIKKQKLENDLKTEFLKYFDSIEDSHSNLLQKLIIQKSEFESAVKQYQVAKNDKSDFESKNNIEEIQNIKEISDISEEDLKNSINQYNIQIDRLVDEKNQIKNQIEFLENKIDEYDYLESDIEALKEEIDSYIEKYETLKSTEQLLKKAKESFSSSYLQDMIQGFNTYLDIIDNKNMNTNVDIKLDVKVDVNGAQKEIKYFSAGYKDLIYICMRFSLINALFKEEKPFVVLDDPLVNLDEEKIKKALEVINKFAEKYQIIYFVCNESRV